MNGRPYKPRMGDSYKTRRANVRLLISSRYDGIQGRFASAIGRSPTYVHRLLLPGDDEHARRLGEDLAREIESKLGLPPRWLDEPHNHKTIDDPGSNLAESLRRSFAGERSAGTANTAPAPFSPLAATVPLLTWSEAVHSAELVRISPSAVSRSTVPVTSAVGSDAFALRVEGDSMAPDFPEGCTIVVDPTRPHRAGDFVVVNAPAWSQPTFKRFVIDAGRPYLKSINPEYKQIEMPAGATVLGVVVEMRLTRTF